MLKERILDRFQKALNELADKGREELRQQGHVATGRGVNSLEGVITSEQISRLVGVIMAEDYLVPVDTGVSASRIPYSGRTGRGGTSEYIQGLMRWVSIIRPRLSDSERKSFAFAIAATHKREGMPSRGSFSFSNNGKRTGWIERGLESQADLVERELRLVQIIEQSFLNTVGTAA